MTKQELIDAVNEAAGEGLHRKVVAEVIDKTFDAIVDGIKAEAAADEKEEKTGKFFMPGFGTFELKERKARTGRNPRTGEPLEIPARQTLTFKAAAALKASL